MVMFLAVLALRSSQLCRMDLQSFTFRIGVAMSETKYPLCARAGLKLKRCLGGDTHIRARRLLEGK